MDHYADFLKNNGIDATIRNEMLLALVSEKFKEVISKDIIVEGTHDLQTVVYQQAINTYYDFLEQADETFNQFPFGMNAIQYAAFKGYHYFLNDLHPTLEQVNLLNDYNLSALHQAANMGNVHTFQALIDLGADLATLPANRFTVLHSAVQLTMQYPDFIIKSKLQIVKHILATNSDLVSIQNNEGNNVAHTICANGLIKALPLVLAVNKSITQQENNRHNYPIHVAILNNQPLAVAELMKIDNCLSFTDNQGRNALHYAAKYSDKEMIQLCAVADGSLTDSADNAGKTPLMYAAESGNIDGVQLLIGTYQATPSLVDENGLNVLDYAIKSDDAMLIAWLGENTSLRPSRDVESRSLDNRM